MQINLRPSVDITEATLELIASAPTGIYVMEYALDLPNLSPEEATWLTSVAETGDWYPIRVNAYTARMPYQEYLATRQ